MVGPDMDIAYWLQSLGLEEHEPAFRENAIDAEILPKLTAEDLKDLGVKQVGHRRKLMSAIEELREASRGDEARFPRHDSLGPENGSLAAPQVDQGERRHLTVMFCDLVGSTELAARLDPEDFGHVISAYHRCVAEIVARFDGFVAKFMGDGVLIYFGYPQAHEDDAERAVHTSLALIEAIDQVAVAEGIRVRVGIDTGLAVVGNLIGTGEGQEREIFGEPPNLAARLQTLAEPNSVVISHRTRRLVAEFFDLAELGTREIKGFHEPMELWRVLGTARAEGRFEARHAAHLSPLVGREEEVRLMSQRWELAQEGDGQALLLCGEAGIGKSRIARTLARRLGTQPNARFNYQCSPSFSNTAFYPLIEQVGRLVGIEPGQTTEQRLDAIQAILRRYGLDVDRATPLLADLLSISTEGRYPPLGVSPRRQKHLTLETLVALLEAAQATEPILISFEDVHWIDPSSREFLEMLVDRLPAWRALAIITCRPEFTPPWGSATHVTTLSLNRLGRRQAAALVESVAGPSLPPEVLDQILAKSDGIPLFIEEITKSVLEVGLLEKAQDRRSLTDSDQSLAIPASLHDSLMARLDRMASAKEVAQVGAMIGREFSYELLSKVMRLQEPELERALEELTKAELIFRRGNPPSASYTFKHALVQDAAYASLLRNKRHELHARIAAVLRDYFPALRESQPELLAHHYTEAGDLENALQQWKRAGERAAERSAGHEALAHLSKALELVDRLPEGMERAQRELALQTALAPVLMLTEGFGSVQVRKAYLRARDLCRELHDQSQLFKVTFGLWHVHQNRGELVSAQAFSNEVLSFARERDDAGLLLQAHHASWTTLFHLADQEACHAHTEQGRALYDADAHRSHKFIYGGHDPGVCAYNHGALTSWLLGYPDRAIGLSREAIALAEKLEHAMSLVLAHCFTAFLHQFRNEPSAVVDRARSTMTICTEQGIAPHYVATGKIMQGWAIGALGHPEDGARQVREGLSELAMTEMNARRPHYLALLAELEAAAGRFDNALEALSEAQTLIEETGERRWEAEIHRLKAECIQSLSLRRNTEAIESLLQKAINVAANQGAKSLELRAAESLARYWTRLGRKREARDLIAPICGWFSEGADTSDLKRCHTLLKELA